LLNQREVNDGTHIVVVENNFPLIGASAPGNLAEEAFTCFTQAVGGSARRLLQVVEKSS
jgi:hypothetical protein